MNWSKLEDINDAIANGIGRAVDRYGVLLYLGLLVSVFAGLLLGAVACPAHPATAQEGPPMPPMRKVIQTSVQHRMHSLTEAYVIHALCDDGTMWMSVDGRRWKQIYDVPQGAAE